MLGSSRLSIQASDDLGKMAGCIEKAYELISLKKAARMVFFTTQETPSTMPTLHGARTEETEETAP